MHILSDSPLLAMSSVWGPRRLWVSEAFKVWLSGWIFGSYPETVVEISCTPGLEPDPGDSRGLRPDLVLWGPQAQSRLFFFIPPLST